MAENGVLAKLAQYRREFLQGFEQAAAEFAAIVRALREEYLNKIVDATLTDPRLSDVERALAFRAAAGTSPSIATASSQQVTPTSAATEAAVALPEKWPMKGYKTGTCPGCGYAHHDLSAQFCSRCAHPLF